LRQFPDKKGVLLPHPQKCSHHKYRFLSFTGTIIAVVSATDPENDPVVFSLDAASDEFLNIDNSGNLTLAKTLDREVSKK